MIDFCQKFLHRRSGNLPVQIPEGERRKRLGRLGEDAAVRALQKAGYRIVERNYLCRSGEIDIIAEHRNVIVFVEVKTRSPRSWNTPESAITPEKQARVRRAAEYYISAFKKPSAFRFDVVTVLASEDGTIDDVAIIANAFNADGFVISQAPQENVL